MWRKTAYFSKGMRAIRHLESFLPETDAVVYGGRNGCPDADSIAGWGLKPTSRRARRIARRRGLPYIAIEDGFLRSLGTNGQPLSLIVDDLGIYYDASRPSRLEAILQTVDLHTPEITARAERGIDFMRRHRLSKYNTGRDNCHFLEDRVDEGYVIVVDQTAGDSSIRLGLADDVSFRRMLDAAINENQGRQIVVKTHPEVAAGTKSGYLQHQTAAGRVTILADDVDPWTLLEPASAVYTVTSQLGFEALLAGKKVRCFGAPFYAGWGLTEDEIALPRRDVRRTINEVFAAAYLHYARYVDPFTGKACQYEDAARLLAEWKGLRAASAEAPVCLNISSWKRKRLTLFLATNGARPRYYRRAERAVRGARRNRSPLYTWASRISNDLAERCRAAGVPLVRVEDGFLRSVGLGANLVRPLSLVFDRAGIYYDATRPSDLESLIEAGSFPGELIERAQRLIDDIVAARITKYNVGEDRLDIAAPPGQKFILVPGQVENDASLRLGTRDINSNLALLETARRRAPDAFIAFKPHPDVQAGQRPGHVPEAQAQALADVVLEGVNAATVVNACDEVHTMTSLVGFEALLRGKPVHCYGMPFYAGWGLTEDRYACARRTRRASLAEVAAAALILYPRYIDPVTNLWCSPEVIVRRLDELRHNPPRPEALSRARIALGRAKRAVQGRLEW